MKTAIITPDDNGFRIELEAAVAASISAEDMAGELLVFKDAVLVRAETNKNGDRFDGAALAEIASSVPLMPIDYEHVEKRLVGLFTAARVEGDAVLTDGIIYAKRFPDIAADVVSGKLKLSVEVMIGTAMCSVCQGKYKNRKEYCSHLKEPKRFAAARIVTDLKCIGGGVTYNPAGTDTTFDRTEMVFMASEESDGVIAMRMEESQEDGMELEELKAEVQRLTDSLAAANTQIAEKDALVASKDGEIAKLQAGIEGEKRVRERSITLLSAGYTQEQLKPIEGDLAVASDKVIELLVESAKLDKVQTQADSNAGEGDQTNASANDDSANGQEGTPKPTPAALGDVTGGDGGVLRWSPELFG